MTAFRRFLILLAGIWAGVWIRWAWEEYFYWKKEFSLKDGNFYDWVGFDRYQPATAIWNPEFSPEEGKERMQCMEQAIRMMPGHQFSWDGDKIICVSPNHVRCVGEVFATWYPEDATA